MFLCYVKEGCTDTISNASSIFLFNILYAFTFIQMMYFECQNKQFEEKNKVSSRQENNNKNDKSKFYFLAVSFNFGQQVCKTME